MTTTNPTTSPGFSVEEFAAWVRTKPADEAYDYWCNQCALGQFFVATGRRIVAETPFSASWWGEATQSVDGVMSGPFARALCAKPRTFGALATRLEALLPDTPSVWVSPDAYVSDRVRIVANA